MGPNSIISNRITLRRLALTDARNLYAAVRESRQELGEWLDWCREGYTQIDASEWIERALDADVWNATQNFGVFLSHSDDALIGCVGLSNIDRSTSTANLGYWVRTSSAGHGFAREAAAALVEYAHASLGIMRIEIAVHPLNIQSERVARSLGARDEGIVPARIMYKGSLVDAHVFSM